MPPVKIVVHCQVVNPFGEDRLVRLCDPADAAEVGRALVEQAIHGCGGVYSTVKLVLRPCGARERLIYGLAEG